MARKRKGRPVNGVLLVDKPQEVSSNHVVQRVKRLFKAAKAGHTGALDPLATGLLPVCLGEATKFSQFLLDSDKRYFVTAKLGERTNTSDADGEIVETRAVNVSEEDIKQAIPNFLGPIKQVPSMFSALKHEGKPLYFYARQGIEIERPARDIHIYNIEWIKLEGNELSLDVSCSKGTYIRSLIDDLGQMLGCGAHVTVLRRTEVAHYIASQMISFECLDNIAEKFDAEQAMDSSNNIAIFKELDSLLLPMDTPICSLSQVYIDEQQCALFQQGGSLTVAGDFEIDQVVRVYSTHDNLFLGVAFMQTKTELQPKRVVVYAS